jgi:hypothetical protein
MLVSGTGMIRLMICRLIEVGVEGAGLEYGREGTLHTGVGYTFNCTTRTHKIT